MRTVRGRGQGQDTGVAQLAHGAAELAVSPPSVPPPPASSSSSSSSVSPAALAHMLMEPGSLEESPSTLGDKHSGLASWSPAGVKIACLLSREDNSGVWFVREAGAACDV